MYYEYFGLKEAPFSIAPNPRYLYMSERHREALAHLMYGINSDGGFILLTGEVGTGKTTICRCLLEQIPKDVHIAFVLNPKLDPVELLATACDDLGISYPAGASIKTMVDRLNEFLLAAHQEGRRTVLIIDEAQNLSIDVLEQLRLLTNLETNERKLLQIILLGQPELLTLLAQNELRQLSQRVTARFHLDALNRGEVHEYIKHRLTIAGTRRRVFSAAAINRIFKISGGIPRVINLICDRALLGTYAENKLQVSTRIVNKAAAEVLGQKFNFPSMPVYAVAAVLLVATLTLLTFYLPSTEIVDSSSKSNELTQLPGDRTRLAAEGDTQPVVESITANISPMVQEIKPDLFNYLDKVEDVIGHSDVKLAFADLFALWGLVFEDQSIHPCNQATSIGLKCFSNLSGLKEIKSLNRPVVIGINQQWVTLSQFNEGAVTLIAGHRQFQVSARELTFAWNGKYNKIRY
ncbi:MAG: AAA family ATPase, partial [Proteobacteria bacterium]|nr:AAA family ATPase [Pseudomonadota bacterium]